MGIDNDSEKIIKQASKDHSIRLPLIVLAQSPNSSLAHALNEGVDVSQHCAQQLFLLLSCLPIFVTLQFRQRLLHIPYGPIIRRDDNLGLCGWRFVGVVIEL